jgi:hypothetical protein
VFILGCPRSGTTFLSGCLAAVAGVEEFVGVLCPPRVCHLIATEDRPDRLRPLMAGVRDVFWLAYVRRRTSHAERLLAVLRRRLSPLGVFGPGAVAGGLFCYKEPFLCFPADRFAAACPTARCVHIVRDGRDNADSLERAYPDALSDDVVRSDFLTRNKNSEIGPWRRAGGVNVPWWVPADDAGPFGAMSRYERCVLLWREMTARAMALGRIAPDRYIELRYEDLVRDPVGRGRALVEHIGRPFDRPARRAFERAFARSVGVARRNQPAELTRKAADIAGPLLRTLGYEA